MSGFAPLDFLPDVDRNGIRDDIDKQIIDLYENDKRRIHLASRAAKLIQEIAQNEDSPDYVHTLYLELESIKVCWKTLTSEYLEVTLDPLVLNTYAVLYPYLSVLAEAIRLHGSARDEIINTVLKQKYFEFCSS